jgi:hypothetical protein
VGAVGVGWDIGIYDKVPGTVVLQPSGHLDIYGMVQSGQCYCTDDGSYFKDFQSGYS